MTEQTEQRNFVQSFNPPLSMRIWQRLGFRYGAHADRPESADAIWSIHKVVTRWSALDRLRILISGQTEVELCVETDVAHKVKSSNASAVILARGAQSFSMRQTLLIILALFDLFLIAQLWLAVPSPKACPSVGHIVMRHCAEDRR